MEKEKILVFLRNMPKVEALTLEQIASRIKAAKADFPEILPEVKDVYVKDNNLILEIKGMRLKIDGPTLLEISRKRIPEA
ncbi:MAG: hypothetical protein AUJ32_00925 [Parcubacteria group bacterium CG1_02_40_82]|uniref:Uncharacterized protein n=4 Tax=Candidatus Portnoyibacteriota TaxID=1817913 RepID=A0A2M7IIR3_9BACT|nr:MAG: hypothetical protein AUJ32_00925 [Parcubacteria group bacterium CG1_02_40_82]PIQ75131.1 MAG: hypothetical protein COV84_02960 [Candidatus Portnoybacteria bacterium CG11_big_fil_rev_8_21_14_0_20_40_15]PIS31566.1 MAG: hypothetical protein COT41_01435 [Candidatus Portnoybacteria bacterium CG08_land_8_20_14_0_20_40_83]PIW76395.1 MAG: hypothetical protein CO001_01555 [Candidatus Portnoybacteria bacterium CG_4_8_14_3_um_filter_40_10]PIY74917.1 MAG: hypothetical protein COY85_01885 [Candidatus